MHEITREISERRRSRVFAYDINFDILLRVRLDVALEGLDAIHQPPSTVHRQFLSSQRLVPILRHSNTLPLPPDKGART
jgi:hypothetical protein